MGSDPGFSFIVYAFLNFVRLISGKAPRKTFLIIPLPGSGLFISLPILMSALTGSPYYNGFFLSWIGVLSSFYLEWQDRSSLSRERLREGKGFDSGVLKLRL